MRRHYNWLVALVVIALAMTPAVVVSVVGWMVIIERIVK